MGQLFLKMAATTTKLLARIVEKEQSIRITEMLPFEELRSMLDQRLKLNKKSEKLRAILND